MKTSKKGLLWEKKDKMLRSYSTLLNVSLVFVKGGLALFSGSIAILAETIHSFTDAEVLVKIQM
jgi:divalent metal cation (Fe/Co/Zn/Cd) transporter